MTHKQSFAHSMIKYPHHNQEIGADMFYSSDTENGINNIFDDIGLRDKAILSKTAIIKVNLARPPVKNHPRTNAELIKKVIQYLMHHGVRCTIIESADGYLQQNLVEIGLGDFIESCDIGVIDLDQEETDELIVGDEIHYYPKCLNDFDLRIAIPVTSKRPESIYSNNVKLFVGVVPRRYYKMGKDVRHRVKLHLNLHKSVANIYRGLKMYAPFYYFINGGLAVKEGSGEFTLPKFYIGNDAVELDKHILDTYYDIDMPDYLNRL